MLKTTPNFSLFDPLPAKIRGVMGEISIPIVEGLPATEPPKYICIDKTRKKTENS